MRLVTKAEVARVKWHNALVSKAATNHTKLSLKSSGIYKSRRIHMRLRTLSDFSTLTNQISFKIDMAA